MDTADGAGLIDLGEDRSAPTPGPAGPADRYRGPGRRLPPVLAAVLAALALMVTGGAERVQPRLIPLAEVPATRSAVTALTADTAFLADWSDAVVDGRQLLGIVSAYPLPGGAPRWQTRLPVPAQGLRVARGAGVVLATTAVEGVPTVTALDAGTGRILWRSDSTEPAHVPAHGAAALFIGPDRSIRWVDLRSGRDLWSRSLPPYGDFGVVPGAGPTDRTRVLTVSPDGGIEVVDEATGAFVASGRVGGAGGTAGGSGDAAGVGALLGRILVMRRQPTGSVSVTAFDPETVRPLWTVRGMRGVVSLPCGDLLCMPDTDGLSAVDPATGSTAWHSDEWDEARPLYPGRLLASADVAGQGLAVVAERTGQVLTRLTAWASVDEQVSGLPLLLTMPDSTGGSMVGRLDPGRTRPTLLGDLPDAAPSTCQAASGVLVCATVRRTLRLWRYGR